MESGNKAVRLIVVLLTIVLLGLAVAMLGASRIPFGVVKARMDAQALDGTAGPMNAAFFQALVTRLRLSGILFAIAGIGLLVFRKWAQRYTAGILGTIRPGIARMAGGLGEVFRTERRSYLIAGLVILLVAIFLRAFFLSEPMRCDESATYIYSASKPLYMALPYYRTPGNHLFHTFWVHVSTAIFGPRPWAIRLPALIAGILLLPATYLVARIFYSRLTALIAMGLVACASTLILYTTMARGYTMVSLAFMLILALAAYLRRSEDPSAWLLFAVVSAFGFYSVPIMFYPFGVVLVWLVLSIALDPEIDRRRLILKRLVPSVVSGVVLTAVLYGPTVIVSGLKALVANPYVISRTPGYVAENLPPLVSGLWTQWNTGYPGFMAYVIAASFVAGIVFHRRIARHRIPVVVAAIVWILPAMFLQRVVPFLQIWSIFIPIYLILASAILGHLLRIAETRIGRRGPAVSAAIVIVLTLYLASYVIQTRDSVYRGALHEISNVGLLNDASKITMFLKDYAKPDDRLVASGPSPAILDYYFSIHRVSPRLMLRDFDKCSRMLILVNEERDQTVESVLEKAGYPGPPPPNPTLIGEYEAASLYETELR
jgi:4-amino-4-deoxy-L-arabinose transferase-like glycosyltransferase